MATIAQGFSCLWAGIQMFGSGLINDGNVEEAHFAGAGFLLWVGK